MGKYSEEAKDAFGEAEEELKAEIKELLDTDGERLRKLFPQGADYEAVQKLMAAVERSTEKNELVQAAAAFTALASKGAVNIFKDSFKIAKKLVL